MSGSGERHSDATRLDGYTRLTARVVQQPRHADACGPSEQRVRMKNFEYRRPCRWYRSTSPMATGMGVLVHLASVGRRRPKEREHENCKYVFHCTLGGTIGRHMDVASLGRREEHGHEAVHRTGSKTVSASQPSRHGRQSSPVIQGVHGFCRLPSLRLRPRIIAPARALWGWWYSSTRLGSHGGRG
jgi:hypothetical protein